MQSDLQLAAVLILGGNKMGQYWKAMLIEENGAVRKMEPTTGLKLMEHSWIGNWDVGSVYQHIMRRACRVYWVGDYSSDIIDAMPDLLMPDLLKKKKLSNLWLKAWKDEDVEEVDKMEDTFNYDGFLINSTKQEYVDIAKYYEESKVAKSNGDTYCVDPLPLLTALPGVNGQGGGDYFSKTGAEFVGYWSGDIISFERKPPRSNEGYNEIELQFKEE